MITETETTTEAAVPEAEPNPVDWAAKRYQEFLHDYYIERFLKFGDMFELWGSTN